MIEMLAAAALFYFAGAGSVFLIAKILPPDWRARAMLNRIAGDHRRNGLGRAFRRPAPLRRRPF